MFKMRYAEVRADKTAEHRIIVHMVARGSRPRGGDKELTFCSIEVTRRTTPSPISSRISTIGIFRVYAAAAFREGPSITPSSFRLPPIAQRGCDKDVYFRLERHTHAGGSTLSSILPAKASERRDEDGVRRCVDASCSFPTLG